MPSFGVKAILEGDIVSHDCWFESINDIANTYHLDVAVK